MSKLLYHIRLKLLCLVNAIGFCYCLNPIRSLTFLSCHVSVNIYKNVRKNETNDFNPLLFECVWDEINVGNQIEKRQKQSHTLSSNVLNLLTHEFNNMCE